MIDKKNIDFYENAWQHRYKKMKALIRDGEKNPMRIIGKYQSSERTNPQVFKEDGTSVSAPKKLHNPFDFEVLPSGAPAFRTIGLRNQHIQVPYYNTFVDFLIDFISDKSFDAVIELGSGLGQNLIELFYKGGPQIPYYAGEITNSGCKAANMLSDLDETIDLTAFQFDYREPDLSAIKHHGKLLFFTAHSIEQVFKIPENLFKLIAEQGKEVICIHFEPFGFQIEDTEPNKVSELHEYASKKMGWNRNFVETLKLAEKSSDIELIYLAKNIMGGDDMANPTSLAIWKSSR